MKKMLLILLALMPFLTTWSMYNTPHNTPVSSPQSILDLEADSQDADPHDWIISIKPESKKSPSIAQAFQHASQKGDVPHMIQLSHNAKMEALQTLLQSTQQYAETHDEKLQEFSDNAQKLTWHKAFMTLMPAAVLALQIVLNVQSNSCGN